MKNNVIRIEATRKETLKKLKPKTLVSAYCRVSTALEEQQQSFSAQVEYYTKYIEERKDWELVEIFADEAKSGTKIKNRDEFSRMIQECEKGNIHLIITKSITRFARNTVDCLEVIRNLKEMGVGVFFEKENINTLEEHSEQLLTILSSIAQLESENISSNVKWGIQKRFQDGTYTTATPAYGYKNDEDGELIIDQEKAVIVKRIFHEYLNGKGAHTIASGLDESQIPTIRTASKWNPNLIRGILKNSVYNGTLLLQKTYTTDTLPLTRRRNDGELNQFMVEENHEPLVTKKEWHMVKEILADRRKTARADESKKNLNRYEFSSKIRCKECGGIFKRQKVYINTSYEKIKWGCTTHLRTIDLCSTKSIEQESLEEAFLIMWNTLVTNETYILKPLLESLKTLRKNTEQSKATELKNRIAELTQQSHTLSELTQKGEIGSAFFMEQQNTIKTEMEDLKRRKQKLKRSTDFEEEIINTERLLEIIEYNPEPMDCYDKNLFTAVVERIVIGGNREVVFKLINGLELR